MWGLWQGVPQADNGEWLGASGIQTHLAAASPIPYLGTGLKVEKVQESLGASLYSYGSWENAE